MKRKTVPYQHGTHTHPPVCGVNEQGLHVPVVDEHESQWEIIGIYSEPERYLRQKVAHHRVNRLAILLGQKVMSGINRLTPNFNGAFTIIMTRNSNGYHFLIMSTAR